MESLLEVRLALLGDVNVGKTSLFLRFFDPLISEERIKYPEESFQSLAECTRNYVSTCNRRIQVTLVDTAGQERYHRSVTKSIYRKTDAFLFVYAANDECTFQSLHNWIDDAFLHVSTRSVARFYIVGNKIDLPSQVDKSTSAQFVTSSRFSELIETPRTSALQGTNVKDMFQFVVDDVVSALPTSPKKAEDAASIVELHASVEKRSVRIKCQCLARHDECDRLFETKDLTPSKIVRSLEQEIDIDKLIDAQNKKGKARSKTKGKQKSTEEYKGGDLLEGLVIREDDISLQKAHSSAITCHLQINHQRVTLKKNKADCNRRIGIRGGELRLLPSGVTLRISEGATSEPLFIKLSSFSAENNVTINGKTTFANLLQILPRVTFTNTIAITFSLGHFSCCDPQFCLYYNDGWSSPKEYKFMANLREQAPLAKFGTTTVRLTDAQRIEIESFSFCKICILSLPGPFIVVLSLFFRKDYRDKQIELKAVISCQCKPNIKQIRAKARTDGYTFASDWYFRCQDTAVEKQYLEIALNKEENDSFIESKDKNMEFSGEQLRQVIGGSAYQFLTRNCFLKLKSCQEDIDDLSSVMLDCTYWQKPTLVYSVFNYKPTKLDSNPLKIYLLPKDAPTSPLTFSQSYTATDDESDRVNLDKKPTELQLTNLSKNIIKKWKFIGRNLLMSEEEIDLIEKDNDYVREQSYQMLRKSGASISQLCIALNEEELKETACKVFPFASDFLDSLGKKK